MLCGWKVTAGLTASNGASLWLNNLAALRLISAHVPMLVSITGLHFNTFTFTSFLADRTARCVIGSWHHNVRLSVCGAVHYDTKGRCRG